MITTLNHKHPEVTEVILELQKRCYQIEAEILGVAWPPPLDDMEEEIKNSEENFIGYMLNENVCGYASYEKTKESYLITRFGVDPDYLRKGIGSVMLSYLEKQELYPLDVITAQENTPAVRLYEKHGFQTESYAKTEEGIWLVKLRKESP